MTTTEELNEALPPVETNEVLPEAKPEPQVETALAELERAASAALAEVDRATAIRDQLTSARDDADVKAAFHNSRVAELAHEALALGSAGAVRALEAARKNAAACKDAIETADLAMPVAERKIAEASAALVVAQRAVDAEKRRLAEVEDDEARAAVDALGQAYDAAIQRVRATSKRAGRRLAHEQEAYNMLPFLPRGVAEAAVSDFPSQAVGRSMLPAT